MDLGAFGWSVLAGVVATLIVGATYKVVSKDKKTIKQKGNNNTAFVDSTINKKYKGDKKGGD